MSKKPFFISHSSKDKELAQRLCGFLESKGLTCWISSRDILAGNAWAPSILKAIEGAEKMILILTEESNSSQHIARELQHGDKCKIPLIPVMVGDFEASQAVTYFTDNTQFLEWSGSESDTNLEKLFGILSGSGDLSSDPRSLQGGFETECPNCEAELKSGGVFCPYCGIRIADAPARETTRVATTHPKRSDSREKPLGKTSSDQTRMNTLGSRDTEQGSIPPSRKGKKLPFPKAVVIGLVCVVAIALSFAIIKTLGSSSLRGRARAAYLAAVSATESKNRAELFDLLSSDTQSFFDSLQSALLYYGWTTSPSGRDLFISDVPTNLASIPRQIEEVIVIGDSAIVRTPQDRNYTLVLEDAGWKIRLRDEYIAYSEPEIVSNYAQFDLLMQRRVGWNLDKGSGNSTISIMNDLPPNSGGRATTLFWVYSRPEGSSSWGRELLGDTDQLYPGFELAIHVDPGTYTIKCVDSSSIEYYFNSVVVDGDLIELKMSSAESSVQP